MATTHLGSTAPARLALIGSLLAGGVLLGPAANAAEGSAVCVSRFPVSLTPGLSMSESTFRYSSNGQAGTVTCVGSIDGHAVTGPGTVWDEGIGHGSCNGGTVEGFHVYKIPTDAGVLTIQRPVLGMYQGVVGVRDHRRSYPGGFVFYPTTGDCVTAPATVADAVAYGVLS
jgi:hypothetical protein